MRATSPSRTIRVFSSANRSSIENRATFVWSLYLLRRVNGPQGEFLGMVLASMLLNAIADLYQSITLPSGQSIVLLRRDGTMLSSNLSPGGSGRNEDAGHFRLVLPGGAGRRSLRIAWVFRHDHTDGAVQPLPDYPLVIDVGLSKDAALAHWRRRRG
jgi:hypothetical protein